MMESKIQNEDVGDVDEKKKRKPLNIMIFEPLNIINLNKMKML